MKNDIQLFSNTQFGQLGVLVIDEKEYFPATDAARMLGYSNPEKAIRDHCKGCTKRSVGVQTGMKADGTPAIQQVIKTFIAEGDLFRLIVKSKLPAAEKFERWVFDEVLPTVRKHGTYATDKVLDQMLADPDYGIKLFTQLKEERLKRQQLELENAQAKQMIGEMSPKASYYDLILQNQSLMPITKIAKDYGLSGKRLNQLLHEEGIQYKMGDTWLLYQGHADQGYTQSKTHAIDAERSKMHTYWTQKGRLFIYDLLKSRRGILPLIEREDLSA